MRLRTLSAAFGTACFLLLSAAKAQAADELQVALEVRLVSVSEPFFERIGVDFEINPAAKPGQRDAEAPEAKRGQDPTSQALGQAFLSDAQVFQLLEGMQGDRHCNVLQCPRLTLLNGQMGKMESTDTKHFLTGVEWQSVDGQPCLRPKNESFKTGFQVSAKPVVSADRRFVQLALSMRQTELTSVTVPAIPIQIPISLSKNKGDTEKGIEPTVVQMFLQQPQFSTVTVEQTVTIPAGQTVVFGRIKKMTEIRTDFGLPVLSRIPYLNRLTRNVGYGREAQTLLVLVTPRVLVNDEQAPRVSSNPPSGVKQASWQSDPGPVPASKTTDSNALAEVGTRV